LFFTPRGVEFKPYKSSMYSQRVCALFFPHHTNTTPTISSNTSPHPTLKKFHLKSNQPKTLKSIKSTCPESSQPIRLNYHFSTNQNYFLPLYIQLFTQNLAKMLKNTSKPAKTYRFSAHFQSKHKNLSTKPFLADNNHFKQNNKRISTIFNSIPSCHNQNHTQTLVKSPLSGNQNAAYRKLRL